MTERGEGTMIDTQVATSLHSNWTGECIVDIDVMPMIDLAIYHRHKKHSYLGWGGSHLLPWSQSGNSITCFCRS